MLEHVALGQSRFLAPGVAPDPRGVLLGRYGLLVFPSLDGVVAWLRVYAAEAPLDELLADLAIQQVRTPLRSHAMALRIAAPSSYVLDRAARCARLVGGQTYTGTSKHFVKYRDDRAPYGYDLAEVPALPEGTTLAVHGDDFVQAFAVERELPFVDLLFRLSPRRRAGGERAALAERSELIVVAERGLGEGVLRYLWRSRVAARAALVAPRGDSAFAERRRYLYLRVVDPPARIVALFRGTPGLAVFRPVTANVAVELGYDHPIDLASCASVFDQGKAYVFWGGGERVDVIDGPIELTDVEHLTKIDVALERATPASDARFAAPAAIGVELKLAATMAAPRRVVGALVPLAQVAWVKRLVYALPQASLRGQRVAVTDRGVLVLAGAGADVLPLGHPLVELAAGLLVPHGMELVPRVAPDVLARSLGHAAGLVTVFPLEGTPFQVAEDALVALERRALAAIEVARAEVTTEPPSEAAPPTIENDPVGRFALWGFKAPRRERP
jgi:hypothetical protein